MYDSDVENALVEWLPSHYAYWKPHPTVMIERQMQLPHGGRADVAALVTFETGTSKESTWLELWQVLPGPIDLKALYRGVTDRLSAYDFYCGYVLERSKEDRSCGHDLVVRTNIVGNGLSKDPLLGTLVHGHAWLWTYSIENERIKFDSIEPTWPIQKAEPPALRKLFGNLHWPNRELGQ